MLKHIPIGSIKTIPYYMQGRFIQPATMERQWHSGKWFHICVKYDQRYPGLQIQWVVGFNIVLFSKPTRILANFNHQLSLSIRNQIIQSIPAVMKYRISVTRFQKKQWVHCDIFLALSPIKFLFQIARRRRTSRIFTTNVFNVERNLLTSATLVSKSYDETHSTTSEYPNVHLAMG